MNKFVQNYKQCKMNVVVTGTGSGIGKEVVKRIVLDNSHRVLAISKTQSKLDALMEDCQSENLRTFVMDLSKFDERESMLADSLQQLGEIDLLINNAGYLLNKPFLSVSREEINHQFEVNFVAAARMIQLCVPFMGVNKRKGHIVNISSMGGVQGSAKFPGLSIYSASKGALSILTECLAEEFGERNIVVNALAFGAVQTEMLSTAFPEFKAPLDAGEMAEFVVEFGLNGWRYMNGKVLPVSISTP